MVLAQRDILYEGRQYSAGDVIGDPAPDMLERWLKSGAVVIPDDGDKPKRGKAKAVTAPGAPGKKAGGTGAEGEMVGRPPDKESK